MGFEGIYEHTVDDRGRVAIPALYRHLFTEGVKLTLSPDGCVEVYTPEGFEQMEQLVRAEPRTHLKGRRLRRRFSARSGRVELDRQGRILIPQYMREKADLNGAVIIVGGTECLEIWNRQRWEEEDAQADVAYAEHLESLE